MGVLLVVVLLGVGCYAPSAARHTRQWVRDAWDYETLGSGVVLTGPGAVVLSPFYYLAHAFVPWKDEGYFLADSEEPAEKWFRFYTGPMLPTADVAILCHAERSTYVQTIRVMEREGRLPARYEKWHFPICIEALPGVYELEVHYFVRRTEDVFDAKSTEHAEAVEPSRVAWYAEAGGSYVLKALVGQTEQAPGAAPRSRVSRRASLGTSRFELEQGEWAAEIERVSSWDAVQEPVLEHRAAWQHYEQRMRLPVPSGRRASE